MKKPGFLLPRLFLALLVFPAMGFTPNPARAHAGPDGFADLAEKLLPAVVNISTTQTITAGASVDEGADSTPGPAPDLQLPPGMQGSPFEQFFP